MLEVDLCGLRLKNPLILASGILGSSASSLIRISEHAGAVVSKSVGFEPKEGYKSPIIDNFKCGMVNAVGLSSPGAEAFEEELKKLKVSNNSNRDTPLIVSLFGSTPDEIASLTDYFQFADAFELNLSCPHAEKVGLAVGSDPELVEEIVSEVNKSTNKPVFAKLSPNVNDIAEIGKAAERGGADGVVAINTIRGMVIDIYSRRATLSNISGGISGEGVKPVGLKCVWDLYDSLKIPVIGGGGITTWQDVVEYMLAGANAVQIGTSLHYSYKMFYSIKESIKAYLRVEKEEKIENIIGKAHV